jgi:hypothetical protein
MTAIGILSMLFGEEDHFFTVLGQGLRQFIGRHLSWVAMILRVAGAIGVAFDQLKSHA